MTHNSLTRMTAATLLGAAVTAAVVLLMQALIESDQPSLNEPPQGATLTFVPQIEDVPPKPERVEPPKPPDVVPPPPEVVVESHFEGGGPTIGVGITPPIIDGHRGPDVGAMSDGDALPVVKVKPVYPARAQERGIEGYVLVQFTIDELGRVLDPEVLEAQPHGVFERAALKAVERFRYKPRVVNGQPTPVSGVKHLLTFELDS